MNVRHDQVWLFVIIVVGFSLRLLAIRANIVGGILVDPDGYVGYARLLGDGVSGWQWTWSAVAYAEFFKAPLYQSLLSILTANELSVVRWGLTAHAILNTSSIGALYVVGCSLHNSRAGLIAAGAYALWLPNIWLTMSFWQEHLYIPLLLIGFGLLSVAIERPASFRWWIAAGIIFGTAALTRSSVLYYLPIAATLLLFSLREPFHRVRIASFCVAALLVTLPYGILLSRHVGRVVPIEDIGAFTLRRSYPVSPTDPSITLEHFAPNSARAPTGLETVRFLAADFNANPAAFVTLRLELVRMLFKPAGESRLAAARVPDRRAARRLKWETHLLLDLPFVVTLLLCPIGYLLCRQRIIANLLLVWAVLISGLLALTMWAGLRFRAPVEPVLLVLASVALAGNWRRPSRPVIALSAAVLIGLSAAVGANVGPLLLARPTYGVREWPLPQGEPAVIDGAAGMRVHSSDSDLRMYLETLEPADTIVTLNIDGRVVDLVPLAAGLGRTVTYQDVGRSPYVELTTRLTSGQPARIAVGFR